MKRVLGIEEDLSGVRELDYREIFKGLNEQGVDYLVAGGLAVNLHGVPRMTYDIDLIISLESSNVRKLLDKLKEWGYRPKIPVDPMAVVDETTRAIWSREKGMKALTFRNDKAPISEIDILFDLPLPYGELRQRSVAVDLQGVRVPVVSIRDLIELKRASGREQDAADIRYLEVVLKGDGEGL